MIGLFAGTAGHRRAAAELASRWGPDAVLVDGMPGPSARRLWSRLDSAVFFLGTATTVRLIAPLLRDEHSDPAVVCVPDEGAVAVPLAGSGCHALAHQVADVLDRVAVAGGAESAVTVLDEIIDLTDSTVDGDGHGCGRAIADGADVLLLNPRGFPLPALPANVSVAAELPSDDEQWAVVLDDARPGHDVPEHTVRLIPRTVLVGVGSVHGVSRTEVTEALARLDREYGLDPRAIRAFATVDRKSGERGILDAVEDMGFWHGAEGDQLPLLHFSAERLDAVGVPHPSATVREHAATASVAEAAALVAAEELAPGSHAELVVGKISSGSVTVAAARVRPAGRLAVIDLGPGPEDLRVPRADVELRRASVVVGAAEDLDRIRHLLRPGTETRSVGSSAARDTGLELAERGLAVAVVGTGLPAPRAVARPGVECVHIPGVSAP